MLSAQKRKAVNPVKEQNPDSIFRDHLVKNIGTSNALVQEYDMVSKERPIPWWKKDLNIPRWLLTILATLTVVAFTAFAVFAAVVTLKKELNGGACKVNSDCRQDLGLLCNNYRCGCAYSHFWSDSYQICERQRMINRTCTNDTMCDSLGNLQCQTMVSSGGSSEKQCQCQAGMNWNGEACSFSGLYNESCVQSSNCDSTRYLLCNLTIGGSSGGYCRCNTSMFWNGGTNYASGTCEYKRTVNQYCYPYDNNWCDDTGPLGQGLTCAQYSNPYGSSYGICQCGTNQYHNGTRCVPKRLYGESCSTTSDCDYRVNLTCPSGVCTCPSGYNYDSTVNSGGVMGLCKPAGTYLDLCSNSTPCSASQNLYCNGTSGGGICLCNLTWSYWDGLTCISKLTIGGQCSSDTHCKASDGLFCSNYTQSLGTCDCDRHYYWNETCMIKRWYNQTCGSQYECDDYRGLLCQGGGSPAMQGKCDCYNGSYIWDSLYINRSQTCIPKLSYNKSFCYGDLECEDFNYLSCVGNFCLCAMTDYWDGSRCQPKRTYLDPCNYTYFCKDYNPVNLVCRTGPSGSLQCVCNTSAYWENCTQRCVISKKYLESCMLSGNCTSNECDQTANLQCINDTHIKTANTTGWCNCTTLQWWNGTYCRNKGTPSWGVNASNICNATYQCADYNLVSCPLGGSSLVQNATCECATTKYWNGLTCLDRVFEGVACTAWPDPPVSTSTCLSAAGAGLVCNYTSCSGGTCTGGVCRCPTGSTWNATFSICYTPPSG